MTIHGDFIFLANDAFDCPRCKQPMVRHNGRGRRPKCCDACRTPAEKHRRDYSRTHNAKLRKAKAAAK